MEVKSISLFFYAGIGSFFIWLSSHGKQILEQPRSVLTYPWQLIAAVLSFVFAGRLDGVREGTVISAYSPAPS